MRVSNIVLGWPARIVYSLLACLIAIPAYIILLISLIGIPLAFVVMFVPAFAALHIGAELLHRFVFRGRLPAKQAIAASLAVPIVAAIVVAQSANAKLDARTRDLVAGDRDAIVGAPVRRLALVDRPYFEEDKSVCRDLCRRLLMSGAVAEVLVAERKEPVEILDPDYPATSVRFVRDGAACRTRPLVSDRETIDGATWPNDSATIAHARIAGGDCLVERASRLGAADAALVTTAPAAGAHFAARLKLDAFADAVRADRLAFFRNDGGFREDYRRTTVRALRHPPIAIPAVVSGYAFETEIAFLRLTRRLNFRRHEEKPDRVAFLAEELGFDLSLDGVETPDARGFVDGYIAGADASSEAAKGVIEDFIESLGSRREPIAREDALRLVGLLERPSIELPANVSAAARLIGVAHPELAPRAAAAIIDRIESAAPDDRQSKYRDNLIVIAARGVAVLPDSAVVAERSRILRLLADRERRRLAAPLFALLSGGPETAAGDLLSVIDAALEDRRADADDEGWRDLYRAGLLGLCRAAPRGTRTALVERLAATPELQRFHRVLTINTLLRLGLAPDEVQTILKPGLNEQELRRLEIDIGSAVRRTECLA